MTITLLGKKLEEYPDTGYKEERILCCEFDILARVLATEERQQQMPNNTARTQNKSETN